jgi:hypothetical protein
MVRDHGEGHLRVPASGYIEYFAKLLIVPCQAVRHRLKIVALAMEKMIHLTEIKEKECGVAGLNIAAGLLDNPGI